MRSDLDIPASRVSAFVRQHTHDVRNGLNGLDLEAALLLETVADPEAREGVTRIREQVRGLAEQLRSLAARFHEPNPHLAPLSARDLMLILREQSASLPTPLEIVWQEKIGDESVEVDAMMLADLFRELLMNAATFSASAPISVLVRSDGDAIVLEITEPKESPVDFSGWGDSPFVSSRRGHYGLGLWTVRRLSEAIGVRVTREWLSTGALVTRLRLPTIR